MKIFNINILGQDVPVETKVNLRAKRLQFRLDARTGNVRLTLPPHFSREQGLKFVRENAEWIVSRRAKILTHCVNLDEGVQVPINGRARRLTFGHAPSLNEEKLIVRSALAAHDLTHLLKIQAKISLIPLAHEKAKRLGRPIQRLSFRDTRSCWGSCTSKGAICFNWRIMCASPLIQDYLVAHEVAHLKELNHQPSFWALCAKLMVRPQLRDEARAQLKKIGPQLMALPLCSRSCDTDSSEN